MTVNRFFAILHLTIGSVVNDPTITQLREASLHYPITAKAIPMATQCHLTRNRLLGRWIKVIGLATGGDKATHQCFGRSIVIVTFAIDGV